MSNGTMETVLCLSSELAESVSDFSDTVYGYGAYYADHGDRPLEVTQKEYLQRLQDSMAGASSDEIPTTDVPRRMRRRNSAGHYPTSSSTTSNNNSPSSPMSPRRRFSLKMGASARNLQAEQQQLQRCGLSNSVHSRRVHFDEAGNLLDTTSIASTSHKSVLSAANYTVSSHDTVRMSNIKARKEQPFVKRLSLNHSSTTVTSSANTATTTTTTTPSSSSSLVKNCEKIEQSVSPASGKSSIDTTNATSTTTNVIPLPAKQRWKTIKRLMGGKFIKAKSSVSDKHDKRQHDKDQLSASSPSYFGRVRRSSCTGVSGNNGDDSMALRQRARSEAALHHSHKPNDTTGRRVRSSDDMNTASSSGGGHGVVNDAITSTSPKLSLTKRQREMLDHSIRGRLDGVDILFLGSAHYTVPVKRRSEHVAAATLWQATPWTTSVTTGQSTQWTPRQMVTEMLWASAGKSPPEIVLEGIYPGIDSRWIVQVEEPRHKVSSTVSASASASPSASNPTSTNTTSPHKKNAMSDVELPLQLQTTISHETIEAESPKVTSDSLRQLLWGSNNPVPADVLDMDTHTENPIHLMASRCSIPIDLDDETLLISKRDHMQAIHDVVRMCLASGQFDVALRWLETLLQCLDQKLDPDLRSIHGATLHNMGVVRMWMMNAHSQHEKVAVEYFQRAHDERKKYCPPLHPDFAVTFIRKAVAYFAGDRLDDCIVTLQKALIMIPPEHIIRAKALNNLGVAYHCHGDSKAALKELTLALEIQRQWLEEPIRRETTVYDASVTLCNMGKIYLETGDIELALFVFEEALLLLTTIFRTDHDMVLGCLMSLAVAKAHRGQLTSALQVLQGCLRSQNARFGALSAPSIETIGLSGYLYAAFGDYESALKCMSTVRKWQLTNLHENHAATASSTRIIQGLEAALKVSDASRLHSSSSRDMVWV